MRKLRRKIRHMDIFLKRNDRYEPYLMTILSTYLLSHGSDVTMFGIDFYYNGFAKIKNYLPGTFPRRLSRGKQERIHSMQRDLTFWERHLLPHSRFSMSPEVMDYYRKAKKI